MNKSCKYINAARQITFKGSRPDCQDGGTVWRKDLCGVVEHIGGFGRHIGNDHVFEESVEAHKEQHTQDAGDQNLGRSIDIHLTGLCLFDLDAEPQNSISHLCGSAFDNIFDFLKHENPPLNLMNWVYLNRQGRESVLSLKEYLYAVPDHGAKQYSV